MRLAFQTEPFANWGAIISNDAAVAHGKMETGTTRPFDVMQPQPCRILLRPAQPDLFAHFFPLPL